jgi:hypothetical protein
MTASNWTVHVTVAVLKSSRVIEALSNIASMLKIDDNKIRFGIEPIF